MNRSEIPTVPGAWESRAFFAAMLAACRGDDKAAGDILREIAEHMTKEFLTEGPKHSGRRKA